MTACESMARLTSLVPNRRAYAVLAARATDLRLPKPDGVEAHDHQLAPITHESLPQIEAARPGYSRTASKYLAAGHRGVACLLDGNVVGTAWYMVNSNVTGKRYVSYFPLDPGACWLHAAWTHTDHRGKGIHKRMLTARIKDALARHGNVDFVANVETDNAPSLHNLTALGFRERGTLLVVSWWRWRRGWLIR